MVHAPEKVELSTGTHWIDENGCLNASFFTPYGCKEIDEEMMKEHIEAVAKLIGDRKLPFIINIAASSTSISFDALKKWSSDPILNALRTKEAFIIKSLPDLINVNQHLRLNKPLYQAKTFDSVPRAKAWVMSGEMNSNNDA